MSIKSNFYLKRIRERKILKKKNKIYINNFLCLKMSVNSEKIDVWLDCDPGIDDTFAMILAAYSQKINLIGISTVSGNSNVEYMTKNTLKILNLIGFISNDFTNQRDDALNMDFSLSLADNRIKGGLSIPVIQGSSYPILGRPSNADHMFAYLHLFFPLK